MATLREVPLKLRVRGALEVIMSGAVAEIGERYAIVAAAVWPDAVEVPEVSDGGRRGWPAELRVQAVEMHGRGVGPTAISAQLGVPRPTVRDWIQRYG